MSAAEAVRVGRIVTTGQTAVDADAVPDDSRAGLAMFMIFSAAVLIVTGGVALVALVPSWWILGVVFAIHVVMTAVVVGTIAFVMNGR